MTYDIVYEQQLVRRYRASNCSGAAVCRTICIVATVIVPLLIAFATQGFWKKTNTYQEQPTVYFKYRYLFLLRGNSSDKYFLWSSYPVLNMAETERLRLPIVESSETDINGDDKPDRISIRVSFPTTPSDSIVSVFWMLVFDYRLQLRPLFQMETVLFGEMDRCQPLASIHIQGDMRLVQRVPMRDYGSDRSLMAPLIDPRNVDARHYRLEAILRRNALRNITTKLNRKVETWSARTPANDNFVLDFDITYPEDTIFYRTGFFELLKWAWIQYLSVWIIVQFFVWKIYEFLIVNRVLNTIVDVK